MTQSPDSTTTHPRETTAQPRHAVVPPTTHPTATPPPALGRRRWYVLATVALAQLIVVLDTTVVNIALPAAQADLGFSDNDRQWVVTAYALAFGSLLLLGGRLGDLFGRRRMFLIGLVGFALASAVGGAATTFGVLIAARAGQGVFAAVLAPSALAVLTTTFTHPRERGMAFGIFGAIAGLGSAIGLLLGGFLTEVLDWRWNLYINAPVAVAAFVAGWLLLDRASRRDDVRLDTPSVLLASGGLFALVYGFSQAEPRGWDSALTWGSLVLAVGLITVFVRRQAVAEHPLLPLDVVRDRDRAAAYAAILVAGAGMFGTFLFVTYYLQLVLGYSPMQTGAAFMPMVAALVITAQLQTNVLLPRLGPKAVVPFGMLAAAAGMMLSTQLTVTSSYAHVVPGLVLVGIGMGSIMPASFQVSTLGVTPVHAGAASAMVSTSQQVGGAIGTALLNTLVATATTTFLAGQGAGATSPLVQAEAAVHGFVVGYWWSAAFFVVGAVVTALAFRRHRERRARLAAMVDGVAPAAPALAH